MVGQSKHARVSCSNDPTPAVVALIRSQGREIVVNL